MWWLVLASLLAAEPTPPAAPQPEDRRLEEEIAKELGTAPAPPAATPGAAAASPAGAAAAPRAAGAAQLPASAAPASQGHSAQTGGNPFARLLMLPDISAIGSLAAAWNQLDVGAVSPRSDPFAPPHTVQPIFQELELGVQAVVDPYARADVFLTFSPSGAAVEEAYLTTLALPWSLQARAGELYTPFGRINQQHPHVWDFVDRPLALARLAAVDGLRGPGADLSWLAPVSWFAELHVGYQALAPGFSPAEHVAGVARLQQYFDLGTATTLGVGVSGVLAGADGSARRDLEGADVFLKVRPPSSRSYVAVQGELVTRNLTGVPGDAAAPLAPFEVAGRAWGGYLQAVWRDGPFVAYGLRYDDAPSAGGGAEHRGSALVSWMPSEFLRFRLQGSYDRLPGGRDGLEALLHAEFAIGIHGAHPF